PDAARSFNDDLELVEESGISLVSEDEAEQLKDQITHIELKDFDFASIRKALEPFGVSLDDLS
ncbi:MAG: hypothetical protein GWN27_03140, partial [candidate division Zixibacteria bacterium]|nr:hypothetical protein [candidate division Zixibacteria bacterium]